MRNIDGIRKRENLRTEVRRVIYDADERVMDELCGRCDKKKDCIKSVARAKIERNDCVDGLMRWMMQEADK